MIEEKPSRVKRLHHGQQLRLGENVLEKSRQRIKPSLLEGLLLSHADAQPEPNLFARVQA